MHHILLYLSLLFVFGLSTADWLGEDMHSALKPGVASADLLDFNAEEPARDDLQHVALPVRYQQAATAFLAPAPAEFSRAQVPEISTPDIPIRAPPCLYT